MTSATRFMILFGLAWLALFGLSLNFEPRFYRPSDALRHPETSAFVAHSTITMQRHGDLAHTNALPGLRRPTTTRFTTDAAGFRNPTLNRLPRVVVLGDSFVMGHGLDDAETISAQLTEVLGEPVYNQGSYDGASAAEYLLDERWTRDPPRVVILLPVARDVARVRLTRRRRGSRHATSALAALDDLGEAIDETKNRIERRNHLSGLARWGAASLRLRLTGRLNLGRLIEFGGEQRLVLLMRNQHLTESESARGLGQVVATIRELRDHVDAAGSHFIFGQIPEPGLVYDERYPEWERALVRRPLFHDLVISKLKAEDVDCLDLLRAFRSERESYLFLSDDTHWNARGVSIAAAALAERIRPLLSD